MEADSPKLLFDLVDLKPIYGILWVGLYLDGFIERMKCWNRYMK